MNLSEVGVDFYHELCHIEFFNPTLMEDIYPTHVLAKGSEAVLGV